MREGRPLSLLVRNLRYTTSPDRVRRFFEQFGVVRDVYLPLDFYTKLPRGFGFVEFTCDKDAEAALQALSRYATLDGAEISVTVAQQGRKSPDSMRRRERINHQAGRQSHGHYDDYSSRRRRGRGDSRGDYHDKYYRSRSRSYDEHHRSHSQRYKPNPRWSPGHHGYGVMRDDMTYRNVSHRSGSSYSPDHFSHHDRHRTQPRSITRKRTSRSPSGPLTAYRSRKSSSRTSLSRDRRSSVNRKRSCPTVQDASPDRFYCNGQDTAQSLSALRGPDSPSR